MDNLSTHTPAALYETFAPHEARRLLCRLEVHFTPKHASWLNMVEIEIRVLRGQCLDRRIDERALLEAEVDAWRHRRTPTATASNGCSAPTAPAKNSHALTQGCSKSHSLCAEG